MKRTAKRRTRGTTATETNTLSPSQVWRAAFSAESSRRFSDTMERLAVWRDKLPAARRRKMLAAWGDIRDGLADASVAQSVADAQQTVRVAIYGIPPRGIVATHTRRTA